MTEIERGGRMTTRTQAARATADQVDAMLRRLNFTLSAREASPAPVRDEDGWVPGDPLYPMPRWFYGEQYVRPMVELLNDYPHKMRCEPCGVSWTGDDPCWMCGTDRPPLSPMAIVQQDLDAAWQRLQRLAAYRRLHPIAGTYA